jgi:hypothetical protein
MHSTTAVAVLVVLNTASCNRAVAQSPSVSNVARDQLTVVARAAARFAAVDSARSAGFEPVLGWIPMMGTHWVNGTRILDGRRFDAAVPSQLMFSPVNGKQTLVGVAYSYLGPVTDTTRPATFDGNPSWHEHPDLAPPGTTLVMLHVWLVPSPDGPFANLNPFLPFWAAGLTPPPVERMSDRAVSLTVRKAALALAEVADTNGLFPMIARRPAVHPILVARRDTVRAIMPRLEVAVTAHNWGVWDRIAGELARQFDAMRATYLESAVDPTFNARLVKAMDDMLGAGHDHR